MRLLILDNYDSFTYNIVHCVRSLGYEAEVRRNDEISIAEIDASDKIIISPGPGIPSEAGIPPRLLGMLLPTKSRYLACASDIRPLPNISVLDYIICLQYVMVSVP